MNVFWLMSVVVACLAPLPWIMRRPKPGKANLLWMRRTDLRVQRAILGFRN